MTVEIHDRIKMDLAICCVKTIVHHQKSIDRIDKWTRKGVFVDDRRAKKLRELKLKIETLQKLISDLNRR